MILAGGTGERLGGAVKGDIDIGGITLLERALSATQGATQTICVGPERPTSRPVVWTREQPAGGGPVAGLAAGLGQATSHVIAVLAVDHPLVTPEHVRLLVAKAAPAAWTVDDEGRPQPLVAAYASEALRGRLRELGGPAGTSMRRMIEGLPHVAVEDALAARDCDTWDDVEWARSHVSAG